MSSKLKKTKREYVQKAKSILEKNGFVIRNTLMGVYDHVSDLETMAGIQVPDTSGKYFKRLKIAVDVINKTREPPSNPVDVDNEQTRIKRFYRSAAWRKLRYETIVRYGQTCMACGAKPPIINVDHIKPIRKYWSLRLDPENVQIFCPECNHGKLNWDETDWRLSSIALQNKTIASQPSDSR
jgi:5-methylcytosine-specific restriction endonuclease McrA